MKVANLCSAVMCQGVQSFLSASVNGLSRVKLQEILFTLGIHTSYFSFHPGCPGVKPSDAPGKPNSISM